MTTALSALVIIAALGAATLAGYWIGWRRGLEHRTTRRGVRPAKPTTPPNVGATPLPPPNRPTPTKEA